MAKLRPLHAIAGVLLFAAVILAADYGIDRGFRAAGFQRVSPDSNGQVILDLADLSPGELRFYRFLNTGNQEVKFFVGRDHEHTIQAAFDANQICYKAKRGYRHEDDWVVCNKCDKAFRVAGINAGGGGCMPVPLAHTVAGDRLVLEESDILAGWRYFR